MRVVPNQGRNYNSLQSSGPPIQMSFDFDQDLREMEEEGTYPDAPPDDEEDDEEDED